MMLTLPACKENLAQVRSAVSVAAEALGADPGVLADIQLAVNEACSNVIRHAYGANGAGGRMDVQLEPTGGRLLIRVHDKGRGFHEPSDNPGAGLGLALIRAVSETVEIRENGGTEVRMTFPLSAGPA
ncbi:MAG: ATP-binding protein [Actinobacteria bacterium]|nr:ATP-binding protein [Actinomycetota bacterium]